MIAGRIMHLRSHPLHLARHLRRLTETSVTRRGRSTNPVTMIMIVTVDMTRLVLHRQPPETAMMTSLASRPGNDRESDSLV